MKLDDANDLLNKAQPVGKVLRHPVPFTSFTAAGVPCGKASQVILPYLKNYQHRSFRIAPENYGLHVSVNYQDGKFVSMILKGTGEEGESIREEIALMLAPAEAKSKKALTLHTIITLTSESRERFSSLANVEPYQIPAYLRRALREGFEPYIDKGIVWRVLRLYVDGKLCSRTENVWDLISTKMVITGYYLEYDYTELERYVQHENAHESNYYLSQRGVIIEDVRPEEEGAFPETHFLFEQENYVQASD